MARIVFCLFVALLLTIPISSGAQTAELTFGSANDVGMSPPVLDAAKMLYSEAVARDEIAGAVFLVARHGKIVFHEPPENEGQVAVARFDQPYTSSNFRDDCKKLQYWRKGLRGWQIISENVF